VEEVCQLRSRLGFLAFHGGNLERVTDDIALIAAERAGASAYAVVQPPGLRWHIPSSRVVPDASPLLASFLDHVDVAIAIHGYGRQGHWNAVLLGGTNRDLAAALAAGLRAALDGHDVIDDLERVPAELRGLHPDNPVNRPRLGGVQMELPPRVRGLTPAFVNTPRIDGRVPITEALIDALAAVAGDYSTRRQPSASS
jgi:phage replication-related protein YjqB (UPF0714/DUF867 family)